MGQLVLVSGDIIENSKNIEVIVNSANRYMDYGGGVCGAIYDKAGKEKLESYCHNKWIKAMKINEIRVTPGFNLKKEIIHIYVPRYYEEKNPIGKLKESYIKLFDIIVKEKYNSVITTSLGTGFHFYPHEEIAEMVIDLLKDFCKNNKTKIILDLPDEETKKIYQKYL